MSNVITYEINTVHGDSGGLIFDEIGRFIGIHKKGSPNSGLTFSNSKGELLPWFLSAVKSKNFRSPCM
jgi:hypothetical protein